VRLFAAALISDQLRQSFYILRQNSLLVIASVFIGASAALSFRAVARLEKVGAKVSFDGSGFSLTREYLRESRTESWSPWIVYAMWLCLGLGILIFTIGVVRL
jgi:hypothetical protein